MTTTIPLSEDTRDRLKAKKTGGESYDSLLNRLMNEADAGTGDS
jgi:predicted CopG family antitoxin